MSSPCPNPEPPVDRGLLEEIRGLDPRHGDEALASLVGLFVDDSAKQLERLREAVAASDLQTARQVGHTLKGSSGNIGAAVMGRLCHQLEQVASGGNVSSVAALIPVVEAEFARVRSALLTGLDLP